MGHFSILQPGSRFADYRVAEKLSSHHDGQREVYAAFDSEGQKVALTVFNLEADLYLTSTSKEAETPLHNIIEEVRVLREATLNPYDNAPIPNLIDYGITTYYDHRYGWITMDFFDGTSLEDILLRQGCLPKDDALSIMKSLTTIVDTISSLTKAGGHYNISPDNIMVRQEHGAITQLRLTGFTNTGSSRNGDFIHDEETMDIKTSAPELYKGVACTRSDVFSLTVVFLLMISGYPSVLENDRFSIDFGDSPLDMSEFSSSDFHKALWRKATSTLSKPLHLVLRKGMDPSPGRRFETAGKLYDFIARCYSSTTDNSSYTKERTSYTMTDKATESDLVSIQSKRSMQENSPLKPAQNSKVVSNGKKALDEVAGMDELKALLRRDFIRIVRNPIVARKYGVNPSNCVLLYGPQGCGKTFIAEKAAQESGLKYKIVKPSDLGSIYLHGSQEKIAELFKEAQKEGPMILIFDEFDAMAPKRDISVNSNQANEVNEMLTQLNNCASRGIYVLATTNRPTLLDPAIMRKGRIDRTIFVPLPDMEARKELFRLEIAKRPSTDIDYIRLASSTENFSCSDISFIVEEAARLCFEETIEKDLNDPIPLSMSSIMSVIKRTIPSVSEDQRKEYLELKTNFESRASHTGRKKVGFSI